MTSLISGRVTTWFICGNWFGRRLQINHWRKSTGWSSSSSGCKSTIEQSQQDRNQDEKKSIDLNKREYSHMYVTSKQDDALWLLIGRPEALGTLSYGLLDFVHHQWQLKELFNFCTFPLFFEKNYWESEKEILKNPVVLPPEDLRWPLKDFEHSNQIFALWNQWKAKNKLKPKITPFTKLHHNDFSFDLTTDWFETWSLSNLAEG